MYINVFEYVYFAKPEEITHSPKPKNCDKFKNPPRWKFLARGRRRAEKGRLVVPLLGKF